MGFFDIFKLNKKPKTDIEYIENQLKTTGIFQGRQFNPTDEFHIEKGTFTVRPHGISQPEAQKALNAIPVGQALQISAGINILVVRSLNGVLLGDIQWQDVKDLQTVYDMVKSGFKVECSLSQKGRFWADRVEKEIWWCEIALPSYDVWSLTGATVWATRIRRYYHCDPDCNKNADRHMTVEEAEYRGMTKCPKCYHLKSAQSDGPSIKKLHRLSAQMTGNDWDYSLKVERILDSAGRETSDIMTHYKEGLSYKNGQVFFGVKLDGKLRYITLFIEPQSIHCNYTVTPADQGRGPGYCRIYIPSPDALDELSEYIISAFDRAKEIYEQRILT